jgi:hypothetical protein
MDATVQHNSVDAPMSKSARIALLGVLLLFVVLLLVDRASLVDPIPLPMTIVSAAIGFGGGLWLCLRMPFPSYMGGFRRALARLTLPVFCALIATFFTRVAVEHAAFVGLRPAETLVEAQVLSAGQERNGGQFATVTFGPGTRSVDVEISSELYDRLDPVRVPGRDCMILSAESGRFGLRRTMLPRLWFDKPIGIDHYKACQT